jgi:hypothetical protein
MLSYRSEPATAEVYLIEERIVEIEDHRRYHNNCRPQP